MNELFYEKEFKALNKNRIKYLVIGGTAVNLYGIHRLTRDLDLMIDLSKDHLEKALDVLKGLDYFTKVPSRKWPKLTAISFVNKRDEDRRIDIFLKNPIDFDKAYKRRKVFKAGKLRISTVSIGDLMDMKNKANRIRDWIDLGSLKRIREIKQKK